jgi:hypothetical protein
MLAQVAGLCNGNPFGNTEFHKRALAKDLSSPTTTSDIRNASQTSRDLYLQVASPSGSAASSRHVANPKRRTRAEAASILFRPIEAVARVGTLQMHALEPGTGFAAPHVVTQGMLKNPSDERAFRANFTVRNQQRPTNAAPSPRFNS